MIGVPKALLSIASLASMLAAAAFPLHSQVLANLAGDYQGGVVGSPMTPIPDSFGTGTWIYYDAQVNSDSNPTSIPSGSVLDYNVNPDGGSAPYVYNTPSGPDALPAVTNGQLFADSPAPAAGYLDVHPGAGTDSTLLRWTAGAGETGNLTLTFDLSRVGVNPPETEGPPGSPGYDDFSIYQNGVQIYDKNAIYIGGTATGTLALPDVTPGTTVDLVVSSTDGVLGYNLSYLSAEIEAPEPSTWAMLGLGALALTLIGRRVVKRTA